MDNRSILQWDKDDCTEAGPTRFDLPGLGTLTVLRLAFTTLAQRGQAVPDAVMEGKLRASQSGRPWGLHALFGEDPAIHRLFTAADTAGVFQVEPYVQMTTLSRLRPQTFYDIVVEVVLVRPGPIQGGTANPYIRRRLGREEVAYLYDSLKPALTKTLGVSLSQGQLMQVTVDAAGFNPAGADSLRRAMGAKRSIERMGAPRDKLIAGMKSRGTDELTVETIHNKLRSLTEFDFPESHTFSFAYSVYTPAWLKVRKPEDFYTGVLVARPMGFWSLQLLVIDVRCHGVCILPANINHSLTQTTVEQREDHQGAGPSDQWEPLKPHSAASSSLDIHGDLVVRLGLALIKGPGERAAQAIVTECCAHGPYQGLTDSTRRVSLSRSHLGSPAISGALDNLGVKHHQAL